MASVLEVGEHGERFFNVFEASPDNEMMRDKEQEKQQGVVVEYFL